MAGELDKVLGTFLVDFCKLFQNTGEVWLNEQLDISREDVAGWSRVR